MPIPLLIFIVVPIVEMWLLFTVGGIIGALPTIGLVLLTAMLGIALLKQQGRETLARLQEKTARGEPPALELLEGAALLVGGALLLTPGFVTDGIGFLCLLPMTRRLIMVNVFKRLISSVAAGGNSSFIFTQFNASQTTSGQQQQGNIYDHDGDARTHSDAHMINDEDRLNKP